MQPDVILIWAGALFVMGGLLFTAARALGFDRLSEPRLKRTSSPGRTLEPRSHNTDLRLAKTWPGLAVAAVGGLLLLAGAAF
jgi:hypothetical protein